MQKRSLILVALICVFAIAARSDGEAMIDSDKLLADYTHNNQEESPIFSWMDWGMAHAILYADGTLMLRDATVSSRLVTRRLSHSELNALLDLISSVSDFWLLRSDYKLIELSDHSLEKIQINIPGSPAKTVSVYGRGAVSSPNFPAAQPPAAFVRMLEIFASFPKTGMIPWDPGYVEILWADFAYAKGDPIPWPENWPSPFGPLSRTSGKNTAVIKRSSLFPTSRLAQLDDFLAQFRPTQISSTSWKQSPILVDGRKMSASYRWPLRGEKNWTSWTW